MDIALAVEQILPAAEYRGSTTDNTPECWDRVVWTDPRIPKPTLEELTAAWEIYLAATEISPTPREKRAAAYTEEADPYLRQYQYDTAEANGLEALPESDSGVLVEIYTLRDRAKASLIQYINKKREIRARFPDDEATTLEGNS